AWIQFLTPTYDWNHLSGDTPNGSCQVQGPYSGLTRRGGHSLVYDDYNRWIVFGGDYEGDCSYSDTWYSTFLTNDWESLPASPFNRQQHNAVYDVSRQRMVVAFGRRFCTVVVDSVESLTLPSDLETSASWSSDTTGSG